MLNIDHSKDKITSLVSFGGGGGEMEFWKMSESGAYRIQIKPAYMHIEEIAAKRL